MDATVVSWISLLLPWVKKDHAIFLDTSDLSYEYAPCVLDGAKIVITNSKVKHSLVDSAYNDRRNECAAALKALQSELDIQALGDLTPEEFEAHKSLIKDEIQLQRAKNMLYTKTSVQSMLLQH